MHQPIIINPLYAKIQTPSTLLNSLTPEKALEELQRRRADKERREFTDNFTQHELFQIVYVPNVIAELAWDYADTITLLCHNNGQRETRRLNNAVRKLREQYDKSRSRYVDSQHREGEVENMYKFENIIKDITLTQILNIRFFIVSTYPDLCPESVELLVAVWQCLILLEALECHNQRMRHRLENRLQKTIGNITPPTVAKLHKLIPYYLGDKPMPPSFDKIRKEYTQAIATQIGLVEFTDTLHETE